MVAGHRSGWRSALVPALCTVLVSPIPLAQAGNYGFLADSPLGRFKAEDYDLMQSAVTEVLNSTTIGTAKSWQNPTSGNGGTITLLRTFTTANGRDCRRVRNDTHAKTLLGSLTMNICRTGEGPWLLDPDARPAK
jgi:surface antigen